ncbi:MAG: hypothetical protein M1814_002709 [Vezdaea aestivalis]|nr:MAG: hypothetical protein M1814_002709 [Vezdaea aestivalis]
MRYAFILSALAGLAVAAPAPQNMDFDDVVADAPPPTQTAPPAGAPDVAIPFSSPSASAAAVEAIKSDPLKLRKTKRGVNDPCAPQPSSASPPTGAVDSAVNFLAEPNYATVATAAGAVGAYTKVFNNLQASINQDGFLRLKTLDSYDVSACAALCDSTTKCQAFNIYVERDPSLAPADACPDPAAVTNVKCTLYGLPIAAATALNKGQYRRQFQVVIAGSNGYNKPPVVQTIPGFGPGTALPAAINAPSLNGKDTYMGTKSFKGPFDATQCAVACQTQTDYESRHPAPDGSYKTCSFFNAYVLFKNDIPQTTVCSFYTNTWAASYATNNGQYRGNDHYTIADSVIYSLL